MDEYTIADFHADFTRLVIYYIAFKGNISKCCYRAPKGVDCCVNCYVNAADMASETSNRVVARACDLGDVRTSGSAHARERLTARPSRHMSLTTSSYPASSRW